MFRDVHRPSYDDLLREQLQAAQGGHGPAGAEALQSLLLGKDTWSVD